MAAAVATYDALEWVHSLLDESHVGPRYDPTAVDPQLGPYAVGALAARNASHHGLRRVVGVADVQLPLYRPDGTRWVPTDFVTERGYPMLRWIDNCPVIRSKTQMATFDDYLAGRDVRASLLRVREFLLRTMHGQPATLGLLEVPNPPFIAAPSKT